MGPMGFGTGQGATLADPEYLVTKSETHPSTHAGRDSPRAPSVAPCRAAPFRLSPAAIVSGFVTTCAESLASTGIAT